MSDVRLETTDVPHLGGTPYLGFAVLAHAALVEQGLVDPRDALVDPADGAVVARVESGPVGIFTYRYFPANRCLCVALAYVLPDWRRRRVFGHAFAELVRVAGERGATRIEAGTLASNSAFARAAVGVGMRLTHHVYAVDTAEE